MAPILPYYLVHSEHLTIHVPVISISGLSGTKAGDGAQMDRARHVRRAHSDGTSYMSRYEIITACRMMANEQ
jgi:hypothetical protein